MLYGYKKIKNKLIAERLLGNPQVFENTSFLSKYKWRGFIRKTQKMLKWIWKDIKMYRIKPKPHLEGKVLNYFIKIGER